MAFEEWHFWKEKKEVTQWKYKEKIHKLKIDLCQTEIHKEKSWTFFMKK